VSGDKERRIQIPGQLEAQVIEQRQTTQKIQRRKLKRLATGIPLKKQG